MSEEKIDDVLKVLRSLRSRADDWKTTPPTTTQLDNMIGDVERCEELVEAMVLDNKSIRKELVELRYQLHLESVRQEKLSSKLTDEIHKRMALTEEVAILKAEANKTEGILRLYDLTVMFNYYFTMPVIKSLEYGSWSELVEKYKALRADMEDADTVAAKELRDLQSKINLRLGGVDVDNIVNISSTRHDIAHSDLCSAAKQEKFLNDIASFRFGDAEHQALASAMVTLLQTVSRRRMS
ncbi:MAG: hypothetical protein EOO06_17910 [Chitinophagaceae bacterium]|nr:MAG: hypothetical protein EOO06_17910 [Chitinophagaceae bacterium]